MGTFCLQCEDHAAALTAEVDAGELEQAADELDEAAAPPADTHLAQQPVPEAGPGGQEPPLAQEALAFVAGYVAAQCQHLHPGLGLPTREAPPSSVPAGWIRAVSRGCLMVPSPAWMAVVREFELLFQLVMGSTVDGDPGIVRRLLTDLQLKQPDLHPRIARKLVTTRMHLRIRYLNREKATAAAARRAAKQVRQHVRSGE